MSFAKPPTEDRHDKQRSAVADQCHRAAAEHVNTAIEQEAAAIALERNVLGPAAAMEWLGLATRREKLESEHYPGDDILDTAREYVRGEVGR